MSGSAAFSALFSAALRVSVTCHGCVRSRVEDDGAWTTPPEASIRSTQPCTRALAILAEPLRAAGMGEPPMLDTNNPGSLSLRWHAEGGGERPRPDSPVWTHGGCYDVVVRWAESGRLDVHTEGGQMVDEPWPSTLEAFDAALAHVAARIGAVIEADIKRFEDEDDGYLPGTR